MILCTYSPIVEIVTMASDVDSGLHFIIKVTARVWTLWGRNCRSDVDLNVDVDLPQKYMWFTKFSQGLVSEFFFFVFCRPARLSTARSTTDVHVFLKPTGFFHPSNQQADQLQGGPGSLLIYYVLTYWPALFTFIFKVLFTSRCAYNSVIISVLRCFVMIEWRWVRLK